MASFFPLFLTVVLTLHAAHSYILLTANLEDVQALAKQLASSPVVDQIHKIWRRASSQFSQQISKNRPHKRTHDDLEDEVKMEHPRESGYLSDDNNGIQRRSQGDQDQVNDELIALGKNASMYLKSIKKLFESA